MDKKLGKLLTLSLAVMLAAGLLIYSSAEYIEGEPEEIAEEITEEEPEKEPEEKPSGETDGSDAGDISGEETEVTEPGDSEETGGGEEDGDGEEGKAGEEDGGEGKDSTETGTGEETKDNTETKADMELNETETDQLISDTVTGQNVVLQESSEISIDDYSVDLTGGAVNTGNQYVWTPESSAERNEFVYTLKYNISSTEVVEPGKIKIEVPAHLLKDRDGNWADRFDCRFEESADVAEDEEVDFSYRIDEAENKVIFTNHRAMNQRWNGFMEISYTTIRSTQNYQNMKASETFESALSIFSPDSETPIDTKTVNADPIYINTGVELSAADYYEVKKYTVWQSDWGEQPTDTGDYYYLVWTVCTNLKKATSPYTLTLDDTFTDLNGSVVGYRFAGQTAYTEKKTIENQRIEGKRYDYVLTRHSKALADVEFETAGSYAVTNRAKVSVTPVDETDPVSSSIERVWTETKPQYEPPRTYWYHEVYGIYGSNSRVKTSADISDYTLADFVGMNKKSIENLRYQTSMTVYPYAYTLDGESSGTESDVGNYGKKKVSYQITDDIWKLEGEQLADEDYDLSGVLWDADMKTARYDSDNKEFDGEIINTYADTDIITLWLRTGPNDDDWIEGAVYSMADQSYQSKSDTWIDTMDDKTLTFKAGVKGVRLTCKNSYYYTKLTLQPSLLLHGTSHVLETVGEKNTVELILRSRTKLMKDNVEIWDFGKEASDYIVKVNPSSEFKKNVTGTQNNKKKGQYLVTWKLDLKETYQDNDGEKHIVQPSGIFYDLLPAGAELNWNSVIVRAENQKLGLGDYKIKTIQNYKDTGRTLFTVNIGVETRSTYQVVYQTVHSYNAIQDYGKNILSSVAYETGNNSIAGGSQDDGGNLTEKTLMEGLDSAASTPRFLYTECRHAINILMAGSIGMTGLTKAEKDYSYGKKATVRQNEIYSYQLRMVNDNRTSLKDLILFDSLEQGETSSDWHGSLLSIDTAALAANGVFPEIYISTEKGLDIRTHHDLKEMKTDSTAFWVKKSEFLEAGGTLADVSAVAVDMRSKKDGSVYVLQNGKSLLLTLYMKAPEENLSGKEDPVAYNHFYLQGTGISIENGVTKEEEMSLYTTDTEVHYRIGGDVNLKKVDATDGKTPVSGATYLLRGISDYGTEYKEFRKTGTNGSLQYEEIEKGTYELLETDCTEDWFLDTELYQVIIGDKGTVSIEGLQKQSDIYLLKDKPRIHGSLSLKTVDSNSKAPINGAVFLLRGKSDYGTEIIQTGTTDGKDAGGNEQGLLTLSNLEKGTYELIQTATKDGYIISRETWSVVIDASGNTVEYLIENEPLHTIRFLKTSSYGIGIPVSGAVFSLTGTSDYGTVTEKTGISMKDGMVSINGLEPGTYLLKETKAPEEYQVNLNSYPVIVKKDGSFLIRGLDQIEYLSANLYNFKDDPVGGYVKVTKIWEDDEADRPENPNDLKISIATEKPSKNPEGYTLTFDANDGTFKEKATTNEVIYSKLGSYVKGDYQKPESDKGIFKGWTTDPDGKDEFKLDSNNDPLTSLEADTTVYAQYQPTMKYAVSIYGIGVDKVKNGTLVETGGLTFGPALGDNYVISFHNHTPQDNSSQHPDDDEYAHRCIHDDTWSEIIEWNEKDPWVYEECLSEGCTKSILLSKNTTKTILNPKFDADDLALETGDGPSALESELWLSYSIKEASENLRWHPNGGSAGTDVGGWGATRIRAMLNGADKKTDIKSDDYSDMASGDKNKEATIYTTENCLLATFPEELQKAIGAREVSYDTVYGTLTADNCQKSYDKLWFFSTNELCDTKIAYSDMNHENEGTCYPKMKGTGDVSKEESEKRVSYSIYAGYSKSSFWTRSFGYRFEDNCTAIIINGAGKAQLTSAAAYNGVAPGFTLK